MQSKNEKKKEAFNRKNLKFWKFNVQFGAMMLVNLVVTL
jgi:hypothetical protein